LTAAELEGFLRANYESLATLVPQARFFVASESGHDIHQDQPELVTEAIRQVVEGAAAAATRRRSCPTTGDRRSPLVSSVCRGSGTPQGARH
jgi:hypothetical protein